MQLFMVLVVSKENRFVTFITIYKCLAFTHRKFISIVEVKILHIINYIFVDGGRLTLK